MSVVGVETVHGFLINRPLVPEQCTQVQQVVPLPTLFHPVRIS